MESIKIIVLLSYLLSAFFGISGITMALLSKKKIRTKLNTATVAFLTGMLLMCFYDWFLYFANYKVLSFGSPLSLRLGSCIISIIFYLWINMAQRISGMQAFDKLRKFFMGYTFSYSFIWLISTFFFRGKFFYTFKWLLLITDIILIILVLLISAVFMSHAFLTGQRRSIAYMVIVTAMLLWNYIAFIWGETSVYWGNSKFIRQPLDLTIIFWLIVNLATIYFVYQLAFKEAYGEENKGENLAFDLEERLLAMKDKYNMTHREIEIIRLVYGGLSNNEIAAKLYISSSTVKSHIHNTFKKLNVKSRSETICLIHDETYISASYKDEEDSDTPLG